MPRGVSFDEPARARARKPLHQTRSLPLRKSGGARGASKDTSTCLTFASWGQTSTLWYSTKCWKSVPDTNSVSWRTSGKLNMPRAPADSPAAMQVCAIKSLLYSRKHSDTPFGSPTRTVVSDLPCMVAKIFHMMPTKTDVFRAVRHVCWACASSSRTKEQSTSSWKRRAASWPSSSASSTSFRTSATCQSASVFPWTRPFQNCTIQSGLSTSEMPVGRSRLPDASPAICSSDKP
mmetsp:Transcript_22278/g.58714  ORF Transcript_22278/g.58714 Transcript_22278/m.58714 type:complete len:234 (+) Transcript_22278:2-703(+)